ncbi:hypothetical protein ABIE50_002602 [Chitinophaga sp. OAE865]
MPGGVTPVFHPLFPFIKNKEEVPPSKKIPSKICKLKRLSIFLKDEESLAERYRY